MCIISACNFINCTVPDSYSKLVHKIKETMHEKKHPVTTDACFSAWIQVTKEVCIVTREKLDGWVRAYQYVDISLQVQRKWRGVHVLQCYVVVLLSRSDDGFLGSYTVLDQFVPPKHWSSPPAWVEDPVDHLINPFSGEFIITMSHLPGRVLNFKIPHARLFY